MLIQNGVVHPMDAPVIPRGFVLLEGDKIAAVGPMEALPAGYSGEVLDAEGGHILPGFIDAHCHLGLFGDALGFEADDGNESTDPCTPQLRAVDGVNPLDRGFREAREGGVTTVLTGPGSANPIAGQFAALKTDGRWVDEMVVKAPIAMKFALGENPKSVYNDRKETPVTRMATAAIIRENLAKAQEYQDKLEDLQASHPHDSLEITGSQAVWKEVLAVYAVKTTTDPDNPQEVATIDDSKKAILTAIFWEMNQISSRTETRTETVITETDDGNGNIVETETTVTQTYLYITVSHKTAEEMAAQYGFDEEQKEQLAELLDEENRSLWSAVLYGIYTEDGAIVSVALSQVGNVGGEPYWSWYGFDSRVEWCACFVSWCANECGYIDSGVIPKFAGCVNGVQWFKDRNQWQDGSFEPSAGQIIFFDWDNKGSSGPQDGQSDHVGIVEKCENGIVYTIEGNSGDSCRQKQYPVGHYEILGYGIPAF